MASKKNSKFIRVVAFCCNIFMCSTVFASQDYYWFESLMDTANTYKAPLPIQKAMVKFVHDDLVECCKEANIPESEMLSYFSSVRIDISGREKETYLIFPSKYCLSFNGAHSTMYWILIKQKNGSYKNLYSGNSDGIHILKTMTNGFRDIESWYGNSFITLKFDKLQKEYKRVD